MEPKTEMCPDWLDMPSRKNARARIQRVHSSSSPQSHLASQLSITNSLYLREKRRIIRFVIGGWIGMNRKQALCLIGNVFFIQAGAVLAAFAL
jgi:hypothetical protein